jgi:predicted amidohydrolase
MNPSPIMPKVGFFQFAPRFGDMAGNLARVAAALRGVAADLVVLPELAFTGYGFTDRSELLTLAEFPDDSATVDGLTDLCRETGLHLVTGFAERQGGKVYNSALLLGPQGVLATYRKLHLFNNEKHCFDPGDSGFSVTEVGGLRIGMMVCFDWAFPEAARILALKGADLICHPSNLVLDHCQKAMCTRCLENAVFAVTANRTGIERRPQGNLAFTGRSQVVAPGGELLHRAKAKGEALFVVEIDVARARDKAITERNDLLADRRPAYYADLLGETR